MPLLATLGLTRRDPLASAAAPPAAPPAAPDADAVHKARLAVEAEIAREPPKLNMKLVRQFVEGKAADLAGWLPAGSGITGTHVRKLPSGGSHRLVVSLTPTPSKTEAGPPAPDGSLEVFVNVKSQFTVDADRIAKALVIGRLALDRKTIRALLDREATRGVAAPLMHELTHAATRFENALPFDQQTKLSTDPKTTIEKLRAQQASVGMMRNQQLIFDVQSKLKGLLRTAGIVPTKEALHEHEQRLIEEKFAADQGEGAAEVAFDNLELARGTLTTLVALNPDLDEAHRKIAVEKMAPALAKLYDEMDAMRQR